MEQKQLKKLQDEMNYEAYQTSLAEAEDLRYCPDFNWGDVVDHYDGTR